MNTVKLPVAAPARVLAVGAWLKNTACLLDGDVLHWSPLHGDLGSPQACRVLDESLDALLHIADGRIDAVTHDLHPDFASTRLAQALAATLGVPAIPVQHHHAHVGVVQAERGSIDPVIGLALDGVGLGSDGTAWGGELLAVAGARWQRLGHLTPLVLPGGDVAAREPWRMAAAALHRIGAAERIVPRFTPVVGERLARGIHDLIERDLNCPGTTSAGRWFDAIAGLAGLSVRQSQEAEAAMALEQAAITWLASRSGDEPVISGDHGLELQALAADCAARTDPGEIAARFHLGLAAGLAHEAGAAATRLGTRTVVLAGGCFHNRLLTERVLATLGARGFEVQLPRAAGPGDAGLALGQAWIAAHRLVASSEATHPTSAAASVPRAAADIDRFIEEASCA